MRTIHKFSRKEAVDALREKHNIIGGEIEIESDYFPVNYTTTTTPFIMCGGSTTLA